MQRSFITASLCAGFAFAGLLLGGWSHAGSANRTINGVPVAPPKVAPAPAVSLGGYIMEVTSSRGVYSTEHFAPVGLTSTIEIGQDGGLYISVLDPALFGPSSTTTINLSPASRKTFVGYVNRSFGEYNLWEKWTLTVSGGVMSIDVIGMDGSVPRLVGKAVRMPAPVGPVLGKYSARIHPMPSTEGINLSEQMWMSYNRVINGALDNQYREEGNVLGLFDEGFFGPGPDAAKISREDSFGEISAMLFFNAATFSMMGPGAAPAKSSVSKAGPSPFGGSEFFICTSFFRRGDTLVGSGWYINLFFLEEPVSGSKLQVFFDQENPFAVFGVLSVQLDKNGNPASSSLDGLTGFGKEERTFNIRSGGYVDSDDQVSKYASNQFYGGMVITSVTSGGALEEEFGSVGDENSEWIYQPQGSPYLMINDIALFANKVDRNRRTWTVWSPLSYWGDAPDWDIDGDSFTIERQIYEVNYDQNNRPISGAIYLTRYFFDEDTGEWGLLPSERMLYDIIENVLELRAGG